MLRSLRQSLPVALDLRELTGTDDNLNGHYPGIVRSGIQSIFERIKDFRWG